MNQRDLPVLLPAARRRRPSGRTSAFVGVLVALCAAPASRGGDDWPDYRGPTHDGHATAPGLPLTWSETENVRWKAPIPGRGWSTPAVGGGRVWLTTADPDGATLSVVALDAERGEVVHDAVLFTNDDPQPRHDLNSYASPSPVLAGGRVFVHFGTYGTAALDAATGEVLWTRRDLHIDHQVGPGSSPAVYGDLLIVHMDGMDLQYVVALRQSDGRTAWRSDRTIDYSDIADDQRKAYETPVFVDTPRGPEMISVAAQGVFGLDPRDGTERWKLRFRGFSQSSRPLVVDGLALVNTGFMTPNLLAVRLGGEGDVTSTHLAWTFTSNVPTMSSPIAVDGHVYFTSENGILSCVEVATGERVFRERVGGEYSASPIHAEGRLYFPSRDGRCLVIRAAPEFELLADNRLDEGFMASPAVSGAALFLRSKTHLYRIEQAPDSGE